MSDVLTTQRTLFQPGRGSLTAKALMDSRRVRAASRAAHNGLLLAAGSAVYMLGLNAIIVPQGFLNGGMVGVVLILVNLIPGLSFGALYLLLNLPLFFLGWFSISRRFMYYTGFGIVAFSALAYLIKVPALTLSNPILAAVFGGTVCGVGAGFILRSAGSAGGMDILAVFLHRKFSLPIGWTNTIISALVLAVSTFLFGLEIALYTMIFIFTQGRVTDAVITGFNKRKSLIIISDHAPDLARAMMTRFHRGSTFLNGSGAYSGREKQVIFCVISMSELSRMKELVFSHDPDAFLVVNDSLDVVGSNLGRPQIN